MRVVVSVKATPGGSQTSQATRYIAYRDRDEQREGKDPRQLFSAKEDGLSFWKAERVLTEGRAPAKDELIHVAVSFREEDFQALSHDETTRQQSLKAVTREAVSQIADELKAERLTWVAGVHRNTDHPHVHLLINRTYSDHETGRESRLTRIPEEMLASRVSDENGVEKINPGSFGLAFENALDRAQERARGANRELEEAARNATAARVDALSKTEKEKTPSADERLLEAARRNPSIAGRELIQEIILRGPMPEPDERPEVADVRIALRTPGLDDPDYRTQPEQADWLGKYSQELRDLYERGAEIKGDVLIIPAEEHELPEDRDQPFITSLSYAHQQIQTPDQAGEFHTLARTIAGETADARTEIKVFRYYYDQIRRDEAGRDLSGDRAGRAEALNRTLDEMRLLAREMSGLETRESIEIARPVISFEETREAEREGGIEAGERGIFHDEDHESVADFHHPAVIQLWEDRPKIMNGIRGRLIQTGAGISTVCAIWPNRCQCRWRAVILSLLTNTVLIMTDSFLKPSPVLQSLCNYPDMQRGGNAMTVIKKTTNHQPATARVLKMMKRAGVMRARELTGQGIHRVHLQRLEQRGLIRRAGRGLYRLADAELNEHESFIEAAKLVPQGVLCLLSALNFHNLTTQDPFEVWMAIGRGVHRPRLDSPPLRIHYFSGPALTEGIEEHRIKGVTVRVYNVAKTVADCFKFRNKIGLDVALEALRECRRERRATIDEIERYAEICRVTKVMTPYLEALW